MLEQLDEGYALAVGDSLVLALLPPALRVSLALITELVFASLHFEIGMLKVII